MIVGVIRRKPVLTYASIVCDMLASVNSVKNSELAFPSHPLGGLLRGNVFDSSSARWKVDSRL